MSFRKIVFKEQAEDDLKKCYLYYEEKQIGLGLRFLDEVDLVILLLRKNPGIFRNTYKNLKEALVKHFPFVILFEIEKSDVIIYSVFHTSQNPKKKTKRIKK